jgi:DNA-binding SARP family transcriptional activator
VHDRRRRADPTWRAAQKLRITTFGRTAIARGATTTEGGWLDQRTGDLLRYLIVRRERAVTADEIGESLWREPGYNVARNVRTCVHRLRTVLEPGRANHQAPDYLVTRGGSYRLNLLHVEIDADVFEARLEQAMALADSDETAAATLLEDALALYGGELFAEVPFAEWALAERARLHDLACNGLAQLAQLLRAAGATEDARRSLERLATLQPLDERVNRDLIELDIACGRHTDAKRRYERVTRMMVESLGYRPAFVLADLVAVTKT